MNPYIGQTGRVGQVLVVTALMALGGLGAGSAQSTVSPTGIRMGVSAPRGQVGGGSVAGVVRDSAGTPQVGVLVELLRADLSLAARVFTDDKGSYTIASVMPGQYALKAIGTSFIPTLKQNLRVRTGTVVDLTLNNLYDLMQWAPQPKRVRVEGADDWAWTLRSVQGRPMLRWLEDGSPIFVWDGKAEPRQGAVGRRLTRVAASGGSGRFGEASKKISVAMQRDSSSRRRMMASAEFSPGGFGSSSGPAEGMVGFRQQMAESGMGSSSVQTLGAFLVDPEIGPGVGAGSGSGSGPGGGLTAASLRSWERLELLGALEAEAGSDQVFARLGDGREVLAALPFASVTLHRGLNSIEYRVATGLGGGAGQNAGHDEASAGAWLPVMSMRDGELVLEHGLHQELGWTRVAGPAEISLVIYRDDVENPMIEAAGRLPAGENSGDLGQWMLVDSASGLMRAAGTGYSTAGVQAALQSRLPGNSQIRLSYASGDALVMEPDDKLQDVAQILQGTRARNAQMASVVLSGTAEGLGTRWQASYRWQPAATVTAVAPFSEDASEPYLNVYIRQPIFTNRQGPGGMEAQLDLVNLLAEGYHPYVTSDGTHLYFAQAQRAIRGGVAFTF